MSFFLKISILSLFFLCLRCSSLDSAVHWGTYKPHLLFALTERTLNPQTFGLFFFNRMMESESFDPFQSTFAYKYKPELLTSYHEHNAFDYASEIIVDEANKLLCQIRFLKESYDSLTNQSWRASFELFFHYSDDPDEAELQSNNNKMAFVLYSSLNNNLPSTVTSSFKVLEYNRKNNFVIVEVTEKNLKEPNLVQSKGFFRIETSEEKCSDSRSTLDLERVSPREIWDVDGIYYNNIMQTEKYMSFERNFGDAQDQDFEEPQNDPNLFYMTFFLQQNCKYTISYDSTSIPTPFNQKSFEELEKNKRTAFNDLFTEKFIESNTEYNPKIIRLSMYAFSNLIGGISYYYGNFYEVNNVYYHSFKEVFTCTPSRNKFPRGFLWDEGFHLLIVCYYNQQLCVKILDNWFGLMDIDGWIAREQIRSQETASGLDQRFIRQDSFEGNPPTLLFPVLYLIGKEQTSGKETDIALRKYILNWFQKMKLWFFWILENQNDYEKHDFFEESVLFSENLNFRWHCKGDCADGNFLGSGLDDYPRQTFGTISKSHLDLHVWILFFSQSLSRIAGFLNIPSDQREYQHIFESLYEKLYSEFLDHNDDFFKDTIFEWLHHNEDPQKRFSHNLGYITLFPLLFGYINDTEILKKYFKLLQDPNHLWSNFGIRSLSKRNYFFGKEDNYWRGPIWIPINFLILRSLKVHYGNYPEAMSIYSRLRENIIKNMLKQYELSGQIWENYDSRNGYGQREGGFCGWSALITLIIKQEYF